jgi:hypothetical protein
MAWNHPFMGAVTRHIPDVPVPARFTASLPSYGDDIYDRRTAAGNVVISVTVEDAMIHQTIDAIDAHHPLDIDEHTVGAGVVETPASMAPLTGPSTTGTEFSSGEVAQADLS